MATVRPLITKADIRAEASHARQIERVRARGRQERATVKARAKASSAVIDIRSRKAVEIKQAPRAASQPKFESARPLNIASSLKQHQADVAQQNKIASRAPQTRTRVINAGNASNIGGALKSQSPISSASGTITILIFTIFGLIIFYLVATHPTGGWFGTLSNGLHALSSTGPLFTATKVSSAPTPTAGATNQTTGTAQGSQ